MSESRVNSSANNELYIQLLGGFAVSVGGVQIPETQWKMRRARSLVKLLALTPGHRLHRDQVIDTFWPDADLSSAVNNFHQTVFKARRVLEMHKAGELVLEDGFLSLLPGPEQDLRVDVEHYEEAATLARKCPNPAAYETAIAIYQGNLLPGDLYEEWAIPRREALRLAFMQLLLDLARLHEARQEYSQAIAVLLRLLSIDKSHEEAHAGLMRLYALSDQRQLAIRQYQTLRKVLSRESEVEPSQSTVQLYREIISRRFSPEITKAQPAHNLPVQLTSFIGREKEIETLKQIILSGQSRLVTLTGAGGVGKTRLVLQLGEELLGAFPQGIWLVELATLTDPNLVPAAVASVLSLQEVSDRPILQVLADFLTAKRALVILDNCEHLVDAVASLVGRILRACPQITIMTTSREILGVSGEMTFRCPSLSFPDLCLYEGPAKTGQYESVRLFVERSVLTVPDFAITPKNAPIVAQVCRRLDGIPLAIELAAARMRMLSIEQIAERLDHAFVLLAGGSRTALPRQQTLKAAIDWSYNLLTPAERTLLLRLSIFSGGWTLEAAEDVCVGDSADGDSIMREEILELLGRLADKSLILVEVGKDGPPRYRMLETIRQYARESLAAGGEEPVVLQHHATYFIHLAQRAEPCFRGANQIVWVHRMEQEIDNLRLALSGMLQTDISGELALASALKWFWHNRGRWEEGLGWLNKGLQQIGSKDEFQPVNDPCSTAGINSAIYAKALAAAGYLHGKIPANLDNSNELEKASALLKESLAMYSILMPQDRKGMASILLQLACYSKESDRPTPMLNWANQSLDLFREEKDDFGLSECLSFLGSMERNCSLAEEELLEALMVKNKIGDIDGIAHLSEYLGELEIFKGNYGNAAQYFLKSIGNFHKIDNFSYKTRCLAKLAWLDWISGETDQAFDKIQKALASIQEHEPQQRSVFLLLRAKIHLSLGQLQEANQDMCAALEVVKGLPYSLPRVSALILAARLAWNEGDAATAINDLDKTIALTHDIRGPNARAEALYYLGRIDYQQGKLSTTKEFLTESLKTYAGLWLWVDRLNIAYPLEGLAGIAVLESVPARAATLFGAANRRFSLLINTLSPFENEFRESEIERTRRGLGEEAFTERWQEGWGFSFDQAVAFALG